MDLVSPAVGVAVVQWGEKEHLEHREYHETVRTTDKNWKIIA